MSLQQANEPMNHITNYLIIKLTFKEKYQYYIQTMVLAISLGMSTPPSKNLKMEKVATSELG